MCLWRPEKSHCWDISCRSLARTWLKEINIVYQFIWPVSVRVFFALISSLFAFLIWYLQYILMKICIFHYNDARITKSFKIISLSWSNWPEGAFYGSFKVEDLVEISVLMHRQHSTVFQSEGPYSSQSPFRPAVHC